MDERAQGCAINAAPDSRAGIPARAIRTSVIAGTVAACMLLGCGSGKLGLTGGSIPIGTAALRGVVVRADNVSRPIDGAQVSLRAGARHNDAASDPNGEFDLGSLAAGSFACVVEPPDNSGLRKGWNWDFPLSDNTPGRLVIALWPSAFDPASVGSVGLSPSSYTLRVGESVRFVAAAYDAAGARLAIAPSLLLTGTGATVAPNGMVLATGPGRLTLTAWVAGRFATANILVIP